METIHEMREREAARILHEQDAKVLDGSRHHHAPERVWVKAWIDVDPAVLRAMGYDYSDRRYKAAPEVVTAAAVPVTAVPVTAAVVPVTAAVVPVTAAAVPVTAAAVPVTAAAVPVTAAAVPVTAVPVTAAAVTRESITAAIEASHHKHVEVAAAVPAPKVAAAVPAPKVAAAVPAPKVIAPHRRGRFSFLK